MKKNDTTKYLKSFLDDDFVKLNENLSFIVKDYERKTKRLDKIIKISDGQQRIITKLNDELDSYKNELELKIEEEILNRKEKEQMLFQQSKMAAMGEMMDAIAHQWKQPISVLMMKIQMLRLDYDINGINQIYISEFEEDMKNQINHMVKTLDEFRAFFRPSNQIDKFDSRKMLKKVLLLIKDELISNQIEVKINENDILELYGSENEIMHLILNILNNAKDAFNERSIKNRQITINLNNFNGLKQIEIEDNAGGIPEDVISNIFKANVTTKKDTGGTGIGLYMSSQIAEKHHGSLSVKNTGNGCKFIFCISDIEKDEIEKQ